MTHPAAAHDPRHDFDFLFGSWHVLNRRLSRRLEGGQDWEEFTTSAQVRPVLGGLANVDEYSLPDGAPLGFTLRSLNLLTGQWHIHWVSPRDGLVQSPMIGGFQGGVGLFWGQEEWGGKVWPCRFRWSSRGPDHARWEQALSADGGQTWETNWTMTFTRESGVGE